MGRKAIATVNQGIVMPVIENPLWLKVAGNIAEVIRKYLEYKREQLEAQKELALEKLDLERERFYQSFQRQVLERDYVMREIEKVIDRGLETGDNALVFRALDVLSDLIKNPPGRV